MLENETRQTLDVTLNGSRDYVQGSQILSQTAKNLACYRANTLRQATFSKITNRLVVMQLIEPGAALPEDAIGTAIFDGDAEEPIRVAWRETDQPAPRINLPLRCRWDAQDGTFSNPLDAEFRLSEIHDLGDFLDGMVQTIKARHEALSCDVRDIWFTGLRRATFQTQGFPASEGMLTIRCDRLMGKDITYQSLQHVSFTTLDDVTLEAFVTFSFKSEEFKNFY